MRSSNTLISTIKIIPIDEGVGFSGTRELYKLENEKTVSKFIKRGITKEIEWEHGNMGQFWKGTRTDPPGRPSQI